ncbi:uncharacterized protein G2W53_010468 [Senna tora]|uniref:Uncharacterized protein n=1 Tax=Senna tora TaxID=362788 RepID=A0A834X0A9_9FABA|nr:uncharacterized protein G2W53_010468 [Senna tora]
MDLTDPNNNAQPSRPKALPHSMKIC